MASGSFDLKWQSPKPKKIMKIAPIPYLYYIAARAGSSQSSCIHNAYAQLPPAEGKKRKERKSPG
jgi:hypothetical protein